MLPVTLTKEPDDFDIRVRSRGTLFLANTSFPITNKMWRKASFWTSAHDHLYKDHSGICMFCSSWTPRSTSDPEEGTSVEHFVSRSANPHLAYEWTNFRLVRKELNGRKQDFVDVIDPVGLLAESFQIDFPRNRLKPAPGLDAGLSNLIVSTINRLRLNTDTSYLDERFEVYREYAQGRFEWSEVQSKFPFIASEMSRQNFDETLRHLFFD